MFGTKPTPEDTKLDEIETRILDDMITYGPDSKEFSDCLSYLERIRTLRGSVKPARTKLNPNNMLQTAGTLLGILTIVAYEQKHVLTSKAQSFLLK